MASTSPVSTMPAAGATTEAAFVADKQQFWNGFGRFLVGSVASVVILLILMALFIV